MFFTLNRFALQLNMLYRHGAGLQINHTAKRIVALPHPCRSLATIASDDRFVRRMPRLRSVLPARVRAEPTMHAR